MATVTSDLQKARFKESMLKQLAEETAARAQRHHRAGIVLGVVAIAILFAGAIAMPFAGICLALAMWAIKDAYNADAELRAIQERLFLATSAGEKLPALPT